MVDSQRDPYEPSPEQIQQECARIRAKWSETERLIRAGRSVEEPESGTPDEPLGDPPEI